MKYLMIDSRMRKQEKEYLKSLDYQLIEFIPSDKIYAEISSHADIFACKINNTIFAEKSKFELISSQIGIKKVNLSDRSKFCAVKNTQKT